MSRSGQGVLVVLEMTVQPASARVAGLRDLDSARHGDQLIQPAAAI